ncbi:mannitol dehydrogenase family protein [Sphingomonas sp. 1P08PE]|uniref:mannitol dehydrogenase family protein n=1 Tax=Sphingomonas sp. 1P08PE TaxID=554122 RepID=UPI00399F01DE
MRLSDETSGHLPAHVARPGYDRTAQRRGIVHLGIGAFTRAHQAVHTDAAMAAGDRDWAITGVSLRSAGVAEALVPQDGLYTVTGRRDAGARVQLVGAVRELLVAPRDPAAVIAALADPATRIVTLTVTEKGYCLAPDRSLDLAAVRAADPGIYHYLAQGMAARRAAGLPGFTLVSCDNLAGNGERLGQALAEWLDATDPALARWCATECAFPSTMVDRIVPAATAAVLDDADARLGMRDEGALITEPFHQWVIEDRFAGPRPRWEAGGAQIVTDVRPFETAKLRMLNGAHSALAYLGLAAGYAHVHEAIGDPTIRRTVERLMREEAAPTVDRAPDQDLDAYAGALLGRFANAALPHRLAQIATDGSQKIGPRWLEPLRINLAAGRRSPATLAALAAWLRFVRADAHRVDDPMADALARCWTIAGTQGVVDAILGPRGILPAGAAIDDTDRAALTRLLR